MSIKSLANIGKDVSSRIDMSEEELEEMLRSEGAERVRDFLVREKIPKWEVVFIYRLWRAALDGKAWASKLILEHFIKGNEGEGSVPQISIEVKGWDEDEEEGRDKVKS